MLLLHLSDVDEASWAGKLKAALAPYPVVRRGDDATRVDWAHDSAWRFMPLVRDFRQILPDIAHAIT